MPSPASNSVRPPDHAIVLFDGDCGFCNAAVSFIHARDPSGRFQFAPLQSAAGRALLARHKLPAGDTVVLIENSRAFTRSSAALRVASRLRWPWPLLAGMRLIPRFLRDWAYTAFARRRRRWFSRSRCMLPSPELRARFVDNLDPE
ncbi:MAG: thiol-disulfide oxidoreductase DCC family protein [Tepidisphaerales bacterium]